MTASEPQAIPCGEKPGGKVRFTAENARYWQAKGYEAKLARKLQPQPTEEPKAEPAVVEPIKPPDTFVAKTLTRVRKQLTRLLDMLEECDDPIKCDRLGAAIGRLAEIEQKLAGRPLPGSLRPASPKQRQSRSGNSMPEPTPIGE